MRWLLERRYQADYTIPLEELYVNTLRTTLDNMFSDWFENAIMEADRVVKDWAIAWLSVAESQGIEEYSAESFGLRGARVLRSLINTLTRRYVVVDGPFDWRYNVAEINTTVTGRTMGLVRNKRKINAAYAYHILEVLPSSHRFWPSQTAFRLLQVASRTCREILEETTQKTGESIPSRTATTLAISPRWGTLLEIEGTPYEKSSLHLLDTIVDQMHAISIVPHEAQDKCDACPFSKACNIKYLSNTFKERPGKARKEIEGVLCHIQQPTSYTNWQTTLESIMGFSSTRRKVRVK